MSDLILRYPFRTGMIILAAVVSAALWGGTLAGVVIWGSSARLQGSDDVETQTTRSAVDEAFPTSTARPDWTPRPAPDFTLVDQDHQAVTLSAIRGKVALVNFIFTQCKEACPQVTRELRGLQEHFKGRMGRDLVFLSITLDSQHDSPKVLKEYGRKHSVDFSSWRLLTGSQEEIDAVRKGFGVQAEKVKTKTGDMDILHTATVYAIDRRGFIADMLQPGVLSLFGAAVIERTLQTSDG